MLSLMQYYFDFWIEDLKFQLNNTIIQQQQQQQQQLYSIFLNIKFTN